MRGWKVPAAGEYIGLGLHLHTLCSEVGVCVRHQEKALMGKNSAKKKSGQFPAGTFWCPKWHLHAVRTEHASNF